ncbi:MAG: phospholipase [Chitinophagaceae bacterium]|nr:MAG: phospholipase [Chitinophagaceae bacterium]
MTKQFLTLLICATLLISCSPTKKQFGLAVIENAADTTLSREAVLQIRSLNNNVFDSATFKGNEQIAIKYRLFKPTSAAAAAKYPLVVVYHGSGRPVGTDNTSQLGVLPKLFAGSAIQQKYPAYVLAPQFPTRSSDYITDSTRNLLRSEARPVLNSVLQLIDSLKSTLNIDEKRIYVIGFSMGGSTAINSLSARPELFAAGISIAGIPQFDKLPALEALPIWLIHGMNDTENQINSDEQFYKEKKHAILFWKLKETTHDNVFSTTILGETMPKWLFKQRRK